MGHKRREVSQPCRQRQLDLIVHVWFPQGSHLHLKSRIFYAIPRSANVSRRVARSRWRLATRPRHLLVVKKEKRRESIVEPLQLHHKTIKFSLEKATQAATRYRQSVHLSSFSSFVCLSFSYQCQCPPPLPFCVSVFSTGSNFVMVNKYNVSLKLIHTRSVIHIYSDSN